MNIPNTIYGYFGASVTRKPFFQALSAGGRQNENPDDYMLIEERQLPTNGATEDGEGGAVVEKQLPMVQTPRQRIMATDECIMDAVAGWSGWLGNFALRRKGSVSIPVTRSARL